MAVDRVGATPRPLSIPDRQSGQPGPSVRGPIDARDSNAPYPVTPMAPAGPAHVGMPFDGPDAQPLPQSGLDALAAALADLPNAAEPSAMRPNQVFLSRQMVWQPPDTAMMAGSWQTMVRTYGEQRAAWLEQAAGQHVPSSLFMADHTPSALREGRPGLPLVTEMEPWRFAVFAWGAERLVLRVVVNDDEEPERQRRKRARVALRLELMLPGLGRVVIQMEPAAGNGVIMEVGAAHTSAMQHMREILPHLAAMVGRCGLTILRCRLRRELPPTSTEHPYPTRAHTAALTAAVFKAMAEMAVMLSQPLPPDDVFAETA
ncbi:hypothetical protein [Burkholderia sp. LMU1-1-1.1]|uniref:hypothetical protein n=1 Tax=Burkholderia sp. LMU1-1-1.1 TaxID=3135266 RepID=UPI003449E4BB